MHLSAEDHARITAAIVAAEAASDGEIMTIVAARSDPYRDIASAYAAAAMLLVPVLLALAPDAWIARAEGWLLGWNGTFSRAQALIALAAAMTAAYLIARLVLAWLPFRLALTPGWIEKRRVRLRAIELFRTGAEQKTRGRTGILLYLSLGEHRAEIVADQAIHSRVAPDAWRDAMATLIDEVKAGRPGDGMALAVEKVGATLAKILPPQADKTNELPDRVVEL